MSRAAPRFKRTNPPLPVVGAGNGVVVYKVFGLIEGQMTVNTFYYSAAVPSPTGTALNTLLGNISTLLFGPYKACVSADWTCNFEKIDVVHVNNIQGILKSNNNGLAGGRPAGHMPTEVSLPVIRVSGVKGQHGRGRISLPALSSGDVTASKVTLPAAITAVNALATAMLSTTTDGISTWTPCITQRATTSPKLIIGFAPLTAVSSNFLLGTTRRRKIGRGK